MCTNNLKWLEDVKCIYNKHISPLIRKLFAVLEVVFYTTLPTIILILFSIIDKNMDIKSTIGKECYIHGEFLLYSIALLSSAYTTMKVYRNQNTSFTIILIILLSISYAITIKTEEIRDDALLWISIIASAFSLYFTWHAMGLKNINPKSFPERDKIASEEIQDELNYGEE